MSSKISKFKMSSKISFKHELQNIIIQSWLQNIKIKSEIRNSQIHEHWISLDWQYVRNIWLAHTTKLEWIVEILIILTKWLSSVACCKDTYLRIIELIDVKIKIRLSVIFAWNDIENMKVFCSFVLFFYFFFTNVFFALIDYLLFLMN